jgi:hypothetical protein
MGDITGFMVAFNFFPSLPILMIVISPVLQGFVGILYLMYGTSSHYQPSVLKDGTD